MKWPRIKAVIRKDLREVFAYKMVVLPMIIVPLALCIVVPGLITVLTLTTDTSAMNGVDFIAKLIPFYPVPASFSSLGMQFAYIFLNYTFLPFFMLIPIMVASIISANSVVGEKERKTLETLLYTPISNREFVVAKLLSAFIPAIIVSFISFAGYFVVINGLTLAIEGVLFVRSFIWIPALLLLSPAVSLLGLSVTLLVSLRAKTFMEAQQTAGMVVIPFILLVVIQITGLVIFNILYVVLFSLALLGIDYLFITRIGPKFQREQIINTL